MDGLFVALWQSVTRGDDDACWPWYGRTTAKGYGQVAHTGRLWQAHRVAWMSYHGGAIPAGLLVRHLCHNRPCCNPRHLRLGTAAENKRDEIAAGRAAFQQPEHAARMQHLWETRPPMKGEANPSAKLTAADVEEIRTLRRQGVSYKVVCARFGISWSQYYRITNGRSW